MDPPVHTGEVGRLISLVPVGLKEAALDSPTARASIQHYQEQVELLERWLDDYLRATNRVIAESITLDNILSNFTSFALMPQLITETILDHDYSVLAAKRCNEGAKDFWMSVVSMVKRLNILVCEPIRHFQANEIKAFKDARKNVEATQKIYDTLQGKFAALGKTTEPSSLREDAFQLHEARTRYSRAIMEFFTLAPQFRFALDKLIVKMFHGQWKEMKSSRENSANTFQRSFNDMERIKGWTREMEDSERFFKRDLLAARKQLEEAAEVASRPSRDLEEYSNYTIANAHTRNASGAGIHTRSSLQLSAEKQGWLYLRTWIRKPTRVVWVKRWAFVRNGVFGWLVQGSRSGTVEESERIGVLLCSMRPLPHEERRFCFELKTTKHTIGLQAETQNELASWLNIIEIAKAKAVENPTSSEALTPGLTTADPAFAITAPPIPEFGAAVLASTEPETAGELGASDRTTTLPLLSPDAMKDTEMIRRYTAMGQDEGSKDHASRIMSKLDLHRRIPTGPQVSAPAASNSGGIASLIAASHGSMPVGPSLPMSQIESDPVTKKPTFMLASRDMPQNSLAPSTLANMPTPTSLSKPAVVVAGERGLYSTRARNGVPSGILANTWGSSNGSYVYKLDRADIVAQENRLQPSPVLLSESETDSGGGRTLSTMDLTLPSTKANRGSSPSTRRKTISIDKEVQKLKVLTLPDYPSTYPLQLKTQDAQFRLLFPNTQQSDRLLLVFRSAWNPNDQQEFPGRVYVTSQDMYFYSNHLGLVLTSSLSLTAIDEVTAAPGRDCDFLFIHLKQPSRGGATRITAKIFLEPLRLLQKRLNYLINNTISDKPDDLEECLRVLLRLENEVDERTPSLDSWEDLSMAIPNDNSRGRSRANTADLKAPIRVDRTLWPTVGHNDHGPKFKLPAQPVRYSPPGFNVPAVEREFDVSPKALFHVMFGDKSLLWQLLQHERRAQNLKQGPWTSVGEGRLYRDFEYDIPTFDYMGNEKLATVKDYQFVDVNNDHLCYVVTDKKTPWHLPSQRKYRLISKIVITHMAKSKCKMAVFTKVEWGSEPWFLKSALERHAVNDLNLDSQDLADLVSDQVRKLGPHSRTKKAVNIFGHVGQSTEVTQLEIDASAIHLESRRSPVQRTVLSLLTQDLASIGQSIFGAILQGLISLVKGIGKICSAHILILSLLMLSMLFNTWYFNRDTMQWWNQRSTVKFLDRMGIRPNPLMSKAVYLNDIEEAMVNKALLPTPESSMCYKAFSSEHILQDQNVAIGDCRLQRTRQRLGVYRHDLLVAMRVVNSIEQEVVRSEWEQWVTEEHRKCHAVGPIIAELDQLNNTDTRSGADVQQWYETYCLSCDDEYKALE